MDRHWSECRCLTCGPVDKLTCLLSHAMSSYNAHIVVLVYGVLDMRLLLALL